jgi:hypothetical protein
MAMQCDRGPRDQGASAQQIIAWTHGVHPYAQERGLWGAAPNICAKWVLSLYNSDFN